MKLEESKLNGPHFQLGRLVGDWKGTTKTWFDPSKLEDESPITGTMRLILDGRFIMHEYQSSFGDQSLSGIAIFGYDLNTQKFQCAWMDTFHNGTAIMFSKGNKGDESINVMGSYTYITPDTEQHWGWRTTLEIVNDSEIMITAYNVSPEGQETKATETNYRKVL
jgi:hypothetical protein